MHWTAGCPTAVCVSSHWHICLPLLSPFLLCTPQERDQFWKKELSDRALEAAELERRLRAATEGAARDAEALQVRLVGHATGTSVTASHARTVCQRGSRISPGKAMPTL